MANAKTNVSEFFMLKWNQSKHWGFEDRYKIQNISLHFFYLLDDYAKVEKSECLYSPYSSYDNLNLAKRACSSHSECVGIYNEYGSFFICLEGLQKKSSVGTYVYRKIRNYGNERI